jgi:uncharacterized membrane protein
MVKAYNNDKFELPVISGLVKKVEQSISPQK